MSNETPIIYEGTVDVRFSDLDPYNHLNFNLYPEYVITTRWHFAQERFGINADHFIKMGIGFFIKECTTRYKRPITGMQKIHATSFIARMEGAQLIAEFSLQSMDKATVFAQGQFTFVVVDLKTQRPTTLPEEAKKYFFEMAK